MRDLLADVVHHLGSAAKLEGDGTYRAKATWRGGDGWNVVLTPSETAPGGFVWQDHAKGEGGHGKALAALLGLDVTGRPGATRAAAAGLDAWLHTRKLSRATLAVFAVREEGGRLRYPTPLGVERVRALVADGNAPKVKWAGKAGSPAECVYGREQALTRWKAGGVVYIVNGEASAWAAYQAGVPAVCWCKGETNTPTAKTIAALFDAFPLAPVRVVYDADDAGRTGARKLTRAMRLADSARDVTALDLSQWAWAGSMPPGADVDDLHRRTLKGLGDALAGLPELPERDEPSADAGTSSAPKATDQTREREALIPELALARLFEGRHANALLFETTSGRWHEWNGDAAKWCDTDGAAYRARLLCEELQPTRAGAATVRNILQLASANPRMQVRAEQWSADPWLLPTPGGIVDLRSGEIRATTPDDRVRRLAGVTPAPVGTTAPRWEAFLWESCGGDLELVEHLRRLVGYALTGETTEHALWFVYGPGGNGKSVFITLLSDLLGEYAVTARAESFGSREHDQHPEDLARLAGARLVTASETTQGRGWNEARIKELTGGDAITARHLFKGSFTYRPAFKLVMVGNHAPTLRSTDDAIRRRLNIVPFTCKPKAPDPRLEEALRAELPAIMRWAVDGCLAWQANGMTRPKAVQAATEEYLETQDLIGAWLAEECDQGTDLEASTDRLFASFEGFCKASGERPGALRTFAEELQKRGFTRRRIGRDKRGFAGLALRATPVKPDSRDHDGWH